ncbi:MAG: hypothetical protein ACKPKO_62385, partial [Candidatus Fonsibacter sp.]
MFGEKHADRYEYQPIIRAIQDLEDTENYFRPPYAQFKLELAYDDDTPAFKVLDKKEGVRTEVELNSFKEALLHIRYTTKHRMVQQVVRHEDELRKREKEVRDRLEGDRYRVLEQDRPEV